MAARVERLRRALVEQAAITGTEPAPRIGFEDSLRPGALALDLAIQAAGACAAPLPPGLGDAALAAALALRGCSALALFAPAGSAEEPAPGPAPAAGRPPVLRVPRDEPAEDAASPAPEPWAAGSVLAAEGAGWSVLGGAEPIAAAVELAARLAPPAAPRGAAAWWPRRRREVLVLPRPLADPAGRLLAAWSLLAGAALALEPDSGRLAETAAWVRPTVFAGDPGEIAALGGLVGEPSHGRRGGLPLRRLHTVAVLGGRPLPAAEAELWRRWGTAVTVV